MQHLDIITLNMWATLASLLNLLLIYLILKKFLFKPVQNVFAQRKAQVEKLYGDAENAKAQAEAEAAEYKEKLDAADDCAEEILRDARVRADRLGNEIIADANMKANSMIRQAETEIEQEKKKALTEIRGEISEMSVDIAGKVIGREINEEDHAKFIDEFIGGIGE